MSMLLHTIILVLPSPFLAAGVEKLMGEMQRFTANVVRTDAQQMVNMVRHKSPSLIIADPLSLSASQIEQTRSLSARTRICALYSTALPPEIVRNFDDAISIYDSPDSLREVIDKATSQKDDDDNDERKELSPREKEVVIGIVKGLSNKEIAGAMNVSVNTVMTHRRNISSKLKIHSSAGLTIYAIVSKLVSLEEVSIN